MLSKSLIYIDVTIHRKVTSLVEPKSKRGESSIEIGDEETGFVLEPTQVELGSGYAISVRYDETDKPIVDVKTYGDVDIRRMLKNIGRVYPHARIHHLNPRSSVTIARKKRKHRRQKDSP